MHHVIWQKFHICVILLVQITAETFPVRTKLWTLISTLFELLSCCLFLTLRNFSSFQTWRQQSLLTATGPFLGPYFAAPREFMGPKALLEQQLEIPNHGDSVPAKPCPTLPASARIPVLNSMGKALKVERGAQESQHKPHMQLPDGKESLGNSWELTEDSSAALFKYWEPPQSGHGIKGCNKGVL